MSKVQRPTRHNVGHFGDGPPGNHLHWYGQQKINSKINQTNTKKNPKYNNILSTYTRTQT